MNELGLNKMKWDEMNQMESNEMKLKAKLNKIRWKDMKSNGMKWNKIDQKKIK